MVTSAVDRQSRQLLQGTDDAAVIGQVEAAAKAKLERDYPKPDAQYVMQWQKELETRFQPYWGGRRSTTTDNDARNSETVGGDSLQAIRDMRYGRDQLPTKLRRLKQYAERVRTGLSHNEIDRVVALMGRNPLKVEVPASSSHSDAEARAQKQTRFCTKLPQILDKQAPFPVIQRVDDAMVEAGLVGVEFFLTGAYDDIDDVVGDNNQTPDGMPDKAYNDRLAVERRKRKLPFGIRYVDPASLMFEVEGDDIGIVIIAEKKRWRHLKRVVNALGDAQKPSVRSGEDFDPELVPNPGDRGYSEYVFQGNDTADVMTLRYYDQRWYAYVVNGKLVDIGEHGFPRLPVGLGMSRLTSAPDYSEMFQGITWGRTLIEQALNDWATMEQDKRLTFGRPKPIATSVQSNSPAIAAFSEGLQPKSVDLSGDELLIMPPGYGLENAFKDFASTSNDPLGQFLLSVWERGGMSSVLQGDSPGADPSGYLINSMQGAANAKYEGLLDNKARLWEWIIDMARFTIRDLIGEPVEIAVPMNEKIKGKVTWLSLGPDDIDDTPSTVSIDPMNDTNRMAVTGWLMQGREAGLVPDEVVQRRAYGAEDPDEWNDLITKGLVRQSYRQQAVVEAKSIIEENAASRAARAAPQPPSGLVGPNGQPLPPSGAPDASMTGGAGGAGGPGAIPADGGAPAAPQPPSVGGPAMAAQNGGAVNSSWTAGQRPMRQGISVAEAAGGQ